MAVNVPGQFRSGAGSTDARSSDERALERYRYLLRTAPPDEIERAHREAFETLDAEQRQQVLRELAQAVPPSEQPRSDSASDLARAATRAEMRRPGTLEQVCTRDDGSLRIGRLLAANIAGTIVGSVLLGGLAETLFGFGHHGWGGHGWGGPGWGGPGGFGGAPGGFGGPGGGLGGW